jgi:thioredoxin 1
LLLYPPPSLLGPVFEALAGQFPDVQFFKVDVDEAEEVAAQCGIQAMPTFQVFKGGVKVDEMQGANQAGLQALVEKNK